MFWSLFNDYKYLDMKRLSRNILIFFFIVFIIWVVTFIVPSILFLTIIVICESIMGILILVYKYFLPIIIITLSISVMLFNNPIYSLLALISVFFSMVILLLSIKVEFLAMIFLIIYIGAISILFLFVIMLFNLKNIQHFAKPAKFYQSAYFYGLIIAPKFYFVVCHHFHDYITHSKLISTQINKYNFDPDYFIQYRHLDIMIFSNNLYTEDSIIFILLAFILLTSMIGAIVLALSTVESK